MGFLQRVYAAVQKNNSAISHNFSTNDAKKDNFQSSKFVTSPLDETALAQPVKFIGKYVNNAVIENAIKTNPKIAKILKENNLSLNYNLNNVTSIIMSHLIPTAKTAQSIYLKIGHKQNEENFLHLVQAALLHDIGKIFIPEEILNKKGKLSFKERYIIELHNKLSYEILKTTDLAPKVAQLALEHHDYDKNISRSHENQALTVADIYCALREARPYKKPLNDLGAKTILYDMGTSGKFDVRYINYINS